MNRSLLYRVLTVVAATLLAIGALAGASAVGLSAFAAHGLAHMAAKGDHAVALFEQATDFQIKHALALIAAVLLAEWVGVGRARCALGAAAVLLAAGAVLFPTALYSSALGGPVWWAPWGGTMAIVGWIALAVGVVLAARDTHQSSGTS